jgi:hypothetical protein
MRLQQVIPTKTSLNDYVDDANPSDEIDGFVSGEDIFDDRNENEEFIIPVQIQYQTKTQCKLKLGLISLSHHH